MVKRQFLGYGSKQFPDVGGCFGGRFEEEQTGFTRVFFGIGGLDNALIWVFGNEIEFVSRERDNDVLICLALQLLDP